MTPSEDLRTLQLGPLWVLSALVGRHSSFAAPDLAAFWDALVAVSLRSPGPTRELLTSVAADRDSLLMAYELDGRSVVSGLHDVLAALGPEPGLLVVDCDLEQIPAARRLLPVLANRRF